MRGENCPIDSCTATVITVSTTEISVISDVMIVLRSVWAAVGVPVTSWLTTSQPAARSIARVPIAAANPSPSMRSGTNQSLSDPRLIARTSPVSRRPQLFRAAHPQCPTRRIGNRLNRGRSTGGSHELR